MPVAAQPSKTRASHEGAKRALKLLATGRSHAQCSRQKYRVTYHIALEQPARLHAKTKCPLQAGFAHPSGSPGSPATEEVDDRAATNNKAGESSLRTKCSCNLFLPGHAHSKHDERRLVRSGKRRVSAGGHKSMRTDMAAMRRESLCDNIDTAL